MSPSDVPAGGNSPPATVRLGSIDLVLAPAVDRPVSWIGQPELLEQVLACWTMITERDLPLCPRLVGKPGMGKTTLAQAAAQCLERPIHIFQCTMDTRPEDLLVTPVLREDGRIGYHASSLVTAMLTGGVAILDEANRMSEKSWASLAPLLDHRRWVESIVAGVRIEATADFRCCVTMNDDASTYEIPEYIISRIQPMIAVDHPTREEEIAILGYNVDFAPEDLVRMCADFLQESYRHRLDYSTRDGINIMRYALKLSARQKLDLDDAFQRSVTQVLGADAMDFEARSRAQLIDDNVVDFDALFGWQQELEDEVGDEADDGDGGGDDDRGGNR